MAEPKDAIKENSMIIQKEMLAKQFKDLSMATELGKKVVYTFVPGNLTELILSFDMLPVYPEINALQSGMRKKSAEYIRDAEKIGFSEDVCTYVKCDIGMMLNGNMTPVKGEYPKDVCITEAQKHQTAPNIRYIVCMDVDTKAAIFFVSDADLMKGAF